MLNSICKWGISSTMAPTTDIHSPSKSHFIPKGLNTCFFTQLYELSQRSMSSKSVLNALTVAWGFSHFLPLLSSSLTHMHTSAIPNTIGEHSGNSTYSLAEEWRAEDRLKTVAPGTVPVKTKVQGSGWIIIVISGTEKKECLLLVWESPIGLEAKRRHKTTWGFWCL